MKKFLAIITVLNILAFGIGLADEVTVAWDPNTEADLAGYKIHIGTETGVYTEVRDMGLPDPTEYVVTGLTQGETYYMAATAYDANSNNSGFSNEIQYTVPDPPPGAPKGFKVKVKVNLSTGEVTVIVRGA